MKIVHITLHYLDGWGYQDNLLPLYQEKAGNDVVVISDVNHLPNQDRDKILSKGQEYYDGSIKVIRIKCYCNTSNTSFFCSGLYKYLMRIHPDQIFHHGVNSSTLVVSAWYKKKHSKTVLFVDNHADKINMSKNKIWHFCFDRVWLSMVCKLLNPWINKYYGVTPFRCDYLNEVYCIPNNKIGFLPLGCDTDTVDKIKETKDELREQYGIEKKAFVIVSGGKMDKSKGTIELIEAYNEIKKILPMTLVLFGSMDELVSKKANESDDIVTIGWCDRNKTLSLLKLSDVAVWPLLHTTLIEDAVACGIPIIVKESDNVSHFEKVGNGIFLKYGNKNELIQSLRTIRNSEYVNNAQVAREKFSYHSIIKMVEHDYREATL